MIDKLVVLHRYLFRCVFILSESSGQKKSLYRLSSLHITSFRIWMRSERPSVFQHEGLLCQHNIRTSGKRDGFDHRSTMGASD
jgi:hypothetical protein